MGQHIPPFHVNHDGSSCWQCSLRSALEHFNPSKAWTWEELNALTGKEPGGTWSFKTCAELPAMGYEVVVISDLDPARFAAEAEAYVREFYTEGAEHQVETTNFGLECARAQSMADAVARGEVRYEKRNFDESDIRSLLAQGYLLVVWVEPFKLDRKIGSAGHFVLVYAVDGDDVIFHDSRKDQSAGPRFPSRREPLTHLVASAKDGDNMEGLFAIRPKKHA